MWKFLYKNTDSARDNMLFDWNLFKYAIEKQLPPILRIYFWNSPAITIGRNQDASSELNTGYCSENNINIVKRPTGGRACLHHNDLTYAFIAPDDIIGEKLLNSYKTISDALINGLSFLGNDVKIAPARNKEYQKSSLCFDSVSYFEITCREKKILGSAQFRGKKHILQQGTLIIDYDINLYKNIFLGFKPEKIGFTSVKDITGKIPDKDFLINSIKTGFETHFKTQFEEFDPNNTSTYLFPPETSDDITNPKFLL